MMEVGRIKFKNAGGFQELARDKSRVGSPARCNYRPKIGTGVEGGTKGWLVELVRLNHLATSHE
jgi:hypothetical protein